MYKLEKLQKENEESKELYNKLLIGYNKLVQEYLELEKVIDLMAELLCGIDVMNELGKESWNWNKEQMKEYFYKKVEKENE